MNACVLAVPLFYPDSGWDRLIFSTFSAPVSPDMSNLPAASLFCGGVDNLKKTNPPQRKPERVDL
ncbi:hypothetical protein [Microcoleus sp. FACHB-68]|uniref:hypothetical protein n=1 Tax=Microcoleus sp. FACHB-68 TaxID=2692826 RepID=UPI0016826A31|nr:hypothetical protein [Microcoleus sp. FACHB-68]MBD1936129.1 hypothetical protein [Microcoleus sp. FACHB-68]